MAFGLELISAFNLLVAITVVMIAIAVRWWARELGLGELAAATAGVVAALTTFTLGEAPRLQLLSFQWTPLALVCLHRFFVKRSGWAAVGFAACFVMQGLSSQYYLVSSILFFSAVFLVYWFVFPERRNARDSARLAIPLVVLGSVLIPIGIVYLDIFTR